MILAAGCASPESADEAADLGSARSPIVEEQNLNPVLVTSGTCASNGFRPIDSAAACDLAEGTVVANPFVSGPLSTGVGNSSEHGCSVSIVGIPIHGGPVQLGTVFNPGTEQELEAQSCSHDAPCVCNDEATGTPVCQDGAFRPDPHKYYTIRSANGRYMRSTTEAPTAPGTVLLTPIPGDAQQPYQQPGISNVNYDTAMAASDAHLHWRFQESPNGLLAISRKTGEALSSGAMPSGHHYTAEGKVASSSSTGSPFTGECRGAQVILDASGDMPVDTGGLLSDSNQTHRISLPLVFTEPQSPGFETLDSGCVKKSRSCESMFGPEFVQTDRNTCGIFGQLHRLKCTKTLGAPVSMHVPQGWYIEEVTEYSRAVAFDPAPITVDPLTSPSAMSSSMASFGESTMGTFGVAGIDVFLNATEAAKISGPLYGAMFSVGVNAAFEFLPDLGIDVFQQPDPVAELAVEVSAALQKLADDMTEQTEVMIANGLAQESARALDDRMRARRFDLYNLYPGRRANRLALDEDIQTQILAGELLGNAFELQVDIEGAFPSLSTNPSNDDLRRAHFGLDIAKVATTEQLIMLSEVILLEALALDGLTCDQLVNDRGLQILADLYAEKLKGAVEGLVQYGRSSASNRLSLSADELEFDARNFSYPIETQLEFFRSVVAGTKSKCRLLRDSQSSFRQHFVANTPMAIECHGDVTSGDSDGSGTCNDVVTAMEGPWAEIATTGSLAGISDPRLEDVDDDGDLDVVTRHHNQRRLVQWTNTAGALAEGPSVSTPCKPIGLDVSDFDGDGDLDLVAGGNASNSLVFSENALTSLGASQVISAGIDFRSVLAMPVDGDARPDLIAFDKTNQQLLLHLNASDTTGIDFAAATVIDSSLSSNAFGGPGLAALDVDVDGDLDLVVSTAELTVYENLGGSFAAPVTIDDVSLGSTIYAADIDGDGDDDIVGVIGGNAVWYENFSNGDFRAQQSLTEGDFASDLAVGDLDGDGDTDVVLRDATTGELIWVENGLFGPVAHAPIGIAQGAFVVGDLDGDGDGDVVALDPTTNGFITFVNPQI
ncbi:MAG: FG-GAP-like repeat-containing protein [Polyangiaceae bacterium]